MKIRNRSFNFSFDLYTQSICRVSVYSAMNSGEFSHVIIYIIQVFDGNNDINTVKSHNLNPPITARYIRFIPIDWHRRISMRVELYGCVPGKEGRCSNFMLSLSKKDRKSHMDVAIFLYTYL